MNLKKLSILKVVKQCNFLHISRPHTILKIMYQQQPDSWEVFCWAYHRNIKQFYYHEPNREHGEINIEHKAVPVPFISLLEFHCKQLFISLLA